LSVTHELKTPLAANKLYLQTIQKRALGEEKRKDLMDKAIQENERLEIMIDNILNASRLENNALKPLKTLANVSELMDQFIDRIHKRNQQEFITRSIQENVTFLVDTFFIETVFNNLIENAIKYAGKDSGIEVYLFTKDSNLVFGVKDNGSGIPKAIQAEMYRKFYRAGDEETRMQKGSGLGLFIVAELIRIHNGKIVYKENIPNGANFEVTL
jgi:K+-sensing histidine kinase KdpD